MTLATLAALHKAAFDQSRPWSEAEFESLLASPFCFVAEHPQAFALGRVIADEAELLTIATHPDARRLGLGRQMLCAFEADSRKRGAKTAFLEVAADNKKAIALYKSAGFHQTATRTGYYARKDGPAIDALIFTKPLSSP